MNLEQLIGHEATILDYQATYVLIESFTVKARINFIGKEEYNLNKFSKGIFNISEESPLLIDYNEPWSTVYINSKPIDPELLISNIKTAIELKTANKRSWLRYVTNGSIFRFENFTRNIKEGNGLLLEAPLSISKEVENICSLQNVQTKSFTSENKITPKKILSIGSSFVIALEFTLHQ